MVPKSANGGSSNDDPSGVGPVLAPRREAFAAGEKAEASDLAMTFEDAGSDEFEGPDGPVRAFWHRSPLGAELVLWKDLEGRLLQAQLDVRGEVAQWDSRGGVRTGLVVEAESALGAEQEEVRFDAVPVQAALVRAVEILERISSLEEGERELLAGAFRDPRPRPSFAPSEAFERGALAKHRGQGLLSAFVRAIASFLRRFPWRGR